MNYKKLLSMALLAAGMITMVSCSDGAKETTQCQENQKFQMNKVTDYLYNTTLDYDFDYSKAIELNDKYGPMPKAACTSISIGNLRGRNLDWFYADGAEFVVRTPKTETRHASIGVAPLTSLPADKVDDGQYHPEYELLPYQTLDGINDAGICINLNIVNYQEFGPWEMKTEITDDDMLETAGPRMILDNCGNLADIIQLYDKYDWISMGTVDETHIMVSGPRCAEDNSYTIVVFEFIPFTENGKTFRKLCCISPDEKDIAIVGGDASRFYHSKADPFIMTNFNLWQFEADKDRRGRLLSTTEHPMGFERYENVEAVANTAICIAGGKDKLTNMQMQDIMRSVYYSNYYNTFNNNFWYTEDVSTMPSKKELINLTDEQRNPRGDINKIYKGKDDKFINGCSFAIKEWANRDRKVKCDLWETLHTIIYNYKDRSFQINVHEGSIYYDYSL